MARRLADALAGRGFLLLPAVALVVHELRYALAYGEDANAELAAQGHGYVDSLAPWLVLLLGLAVGLFLRRVARAGAGRAASRPRRAFGGLWAATSLSLYGIFVAQESLEGLFASGHPGGLDAVVGHGGWWAMVAAVVLGAGVAALLRAAEAVVERPRASRRVCRTLEPKAFVVRPREVRVRPRRPLATAAAGRAPPRPSSATDRPPRRAHDYERTQTMRHARTRRRFAAALASAVVAALLTAAAASAHARVLPAQALAGGTPFTLSVPNEKEDATTTKVVLTVPEGFNIGLIADVDGWERELATTGAGEDERVSKVTWTSTGEGTAEGVLSSSPAAATPARTRSRSSRATPTARSSTGPGRPTRTSPLPSSRWRSRSGAAAAATPRSRSSRSSSA